MGIEILTIVFWRLSHVLKCYKNVLVFIFDKIWFLMLWKSKKALKNGGNETYIKVAEISARQKNFFFQKFQYVYFSVWAFIFDVYDLWNYYFGLFSCKICFFGCFFFKFWWNFKKKWTTLEKIKENRQTIKKSSGMYKISKVWMFLWLNHDFKPYFMFF